MIMKKILVCFISLLATSVSTPLPQNGNYHRSFLELRISDVPTRIEEVVISFPKLPTRAKDDKVDTIRHVQLLPLGQSHDAKDIVELQSLNDNLKNLFKRMNTVFNEVGGIIDNLFKPRYGTSSPAEIILKGLNFFLTLNDSNLASFPLHLDERNAGNELVSAMNQLVNLILNWASKTGTNFNIGDCEIPELRDDVPGDFQAIIKLVYNFIGKIGCAQFHSIQSDANIPPEEKAVYERFFEIIPLLYNGKLLNEEDKGAFRDYINLILKKIDDYNLDDDISNGIKGLIEVLARSVGGEPFTKDDQQKVVRSIIALMLAKMDGRDYIVPIASLPMAMYLYPVALNIALPKLKTFLSERGDTGPSEIAKKYIAYGLPMLQEFIEDIQSLMYQVLADYVKALMDSSNSGKSKFSLLWDIIQSREKEIDFTKPKKILQLALKYYGGKPDEGVTSAGYTI